MAQGLSPKVGALHAAHGRRDPDTDTTPGRMGSFVLIVPWRLGVLLPLARLRRGDGDPSALVGSLQAALSESNTPIARGQPLPCRWKRWRPPAVGVLVPTHGATKTHHPLGRQRHDRVLPRRLVVFPLSCSRGCAASWARGYARAVAASRRRSPPWPAAGHASGVDHSRDGSRARWTRGASSLGEK
jgi:hypothetical protein